MFVPAAQALRQARDQADPESILSALVIHLQRLRWSPEQIALTLARLYPPGHEYRVSHETIYNCI